MTLAAKFKDPTLPPGGYKPGEQGAPTNKAPPCARRVSAANKKTRVFDQVIDKYDTDGDGQLDFDEVKKLLSDMLNGAQPSDDEARITGLGTEREQSRLCSPLARCAKCHADTARCRCSRALSPAFR